MSPSGRVPSGGFPSIPFPEPHLAVCNIERRMTSVDGRELALTSHKTPVAGPTEYLAGDGSVRPHAARRRAFSRWFRVCSMFRQPLTSSHRSSVPTARSATSAHLEPPDFETKSPNPFRPVQCPMMRGPLRSVTLLQKLRDRHAWDGDSQRLYPLGHRSASGLACAD